MCRSGKPRGCAQAPGRCPHSFLTVTQQACPHRHFSCRTESPCSGLETQEEKQESESQFYSSSVPFLATPTRSANPSGCFRLPCKHSSASLTARACCSSCLECLSPVVTLENFRNPSGLSSNAVFCTGYLAQRSPPPLCSLRILSLGPQTRSLWGSNNALAGSPVPTSFGLLKNKKHTCVTAAFPGPNSEPGCPRASVASSGTEGDNGDIIMVIMG